MKTGTIFLAILLAPLVSLAAPSDVVSSDTCKDAAVQELVAAGYRIDCFNAIHGVISNGVCTQYGTCGVVLQKQEDKPKWKLLTQALVTQAQDMSRWMGDTITSVAYSAPDTTISFTSIRPFGVGQRFSAEETCKEKRGGWWLFNLLPMLSSSSVCESPLEEDMDFEKERKSEAIEDVQYGRVPSLSIYAFPESVRLQGRSTIVWVAEHVEEGSCTVSGPGFKEKSDSGQGSTIALNEPTLFTLTCTNKQGEEVSASVLVDIGL